MIKALKCSSCTWLKKICIFIFYLTGVSNGIKDFYIHDNLCDVDECESGRLCMHLYCGADQHVCFKMLMLSAQCTL